MMLESTEKKLNPLLFCFIYRLSKNEAPKMSGNIFSSKLEAMARGR